jgi:hypothetical protein
MANDDQPANTSPDSQSSSTLADQETTQNAWNSSGPSNTAPGSEDRAQLIARARSFLASPQVRLEDNSAKRKFLSEKGLSAEETVDLLRELVCELLLCSYLILNPYHSHHKFHKFHHERIHNLLLLIFPTY